MEKKMVEKCPLCTNSAEMCNVFYGNNIFTSVGGLSVLKVQKISW